MLYSTSEKQERALLAGIHTNSRDIINDTTDESMYELEKLCETAGASVVYTVVQNRADIDSATYMGEGKLEEIKQITQTDGIDLIVFDDDLSPVQLRNLSDYFGVKVLDRSMLILDIFAMRAKSTEGKIQVELAQLKYMLPRLRGAGINMSRTGGGIGTRGPGETKLETDRRHIRNRISNLQKELENIKKHRELLRKRRKKDEIVTVAVVGYTNAGKSSLLNKLTDAGVLAEDKLFATLDPTMRKLTMPDGRDIMLVDTVGFIRKLPHHLIEAFKSTLEEAAVADVLIHVVDASNNELENHISVAQNVLDKIGAGGKPTIMVYNKIDKLNSEFIASETGDRCVYMSVKEGKGIDDLVDALQDVALAKKLKCTVCIPYSMGTLVNRIHESEEVLSTEYKDDGIYMEIMIDDIGYEKLRQYLVIGG